MGFEEARQSNHLSDLARRVPNIDWQALKRRRHAKYGGAKGSVIIMDAYGTGRLHGGGQFKADTRAGDFIDLAKEHGFHLS